MGRTRKAAIRKLWEQYLEDRDEQVRNQLVEHYLPLATKVANRYLGHLSRDVDTEAIRSAAAIGLIQAVERYDPSKGIAFGTFAWYRIHGAMRDEMRSMDHLTRRHRHAVSDGREEAPQIMSYDAVDFGDVPAEASGLEEVTTREDADFLLRHLSIREQTIVYLHHWCDVSIQKIAPLLALSRFEVAKIYHRCLAKLRAGDGLRNEAPRE